MLNRKTAQIAIILALITAICPATEKPQESVSIIPQPVSVEVNDGYFQIGPETQIIAENEAAAEAAKLINAMAPAMGFKLSLADSSQRRRDSISLRLDEDLSKLGDEGYMLRVTPRRISIRAKEPAGLFYGIQTLRQLLAEQVFSKTKVEGVEWKVPCVRITDYPRFKWRGLLVDPARHFIPKQDLLRFIDIMALHKFNSLQIHLTDDQGWRIEIKKYPKLTEIGAWRSETLIGHYNDKPWKFDGKRHGGFYSQDDIREIVRYAAERYINIVPEIEMPGHARAAISAYPYLGVFPEKQKDLRPWTHWGVSQDIFAPRPRTIAFLQDVLTEVMELFPSKYIHIGGDEAVKDQWKQSEEIQAMIHSKGLKDEEELQAWFIEQMDAFLAEHGRRMVGWDEILQGGLAPGATVMSWRGQQGGITAANAGHDVVMAPTTYTYFDYYQGPADKEPLAIGGNLPLKKVYGFEPIPKGIAAEKARHVLGVQGQLWSEYISTEEHREYMAYPRAAALAEVGWSLKTSKDYDNFLARLRCHLRRFDIAGINYRKLD
jgi:hexosaminidase